ncbi:hypothetical protein HGP28_09050 [Vibrio sp. SM6]|uniref:Uncharacterized protein n=1 Tax=Vibrio agarilyticus TaxID=2726741 RepID=A0A7X8TQS3_9VIBR|nr:hypothetical protein [Vibrio agarilyticus]NLS13034.1 hypothetical protein [Vibrio agarilyticus]
MDSFTSFGQWPRLWCFTALLGVGYLIFYHWTDWGYGVTAQSCRGTLLAHQNNVAHWYIDPNEICLSTDYGATLRHHPDGYTVAASLLMPNEHLAIGHQYDFSLAPLKAHFIAFERDVSRLEYQVVELSDGRAQLLQQSRHTWLAKLGLIMLVSWLIYSAQRWL